MKSPGSKPHRITLARAVAAHRMPLAAVATRHAVLRRQIRAARPWHRKVALHPLSLALLAVLGVLFIFLTVAASSAHRSDLADAFIGSTHWLELAWPSYALALLVVTSFWLGEHRQLRRMLAGN